MSKRSIKKILIIRFSSIGDIVLTTPVIRCLKKQLNVEIHYCTKPSFRGILEENPYIDKVHTLDGSLGDLIKSLKAEKFDFVVDLHSNIRTRIIKLRLGIQSQTFDKLNFKKWLFVQFKINKMPAVHIVDRYMETIKKLGIENDNEGLDYFIPEKDEIENEWIPETHKKGYVALVIGGTHATKRLTNQRLIELCDKINKPIVLLGGKEDINAANEIEQFFKPNKEGIVSEDELKGINKKAVIFNAVGKFNLNQSAHWVKEARYVFTHDTGLMHIAAAFKKEVYSMWGNTSPFFGMYPYQTKFTIFENNNLECRPCSKIGYNECPKGHFKCVKEMNFDFFLPDFE